MSTVKNFYAKRLKRSYLSNLKKMISKSGGVEPPLPNLGGGGATLYKLAIAPATVWRPCYKWTVMTFIFILFSYHF